ncbi:MAG: response regulator [Candidatus Eisenbacteria bacterium]|nr:response regulator [Candidatus Eisenbacteria bacterium]
MGKNILIVDDEKDWIQVLAMRLGHEGYKTEAAFDTIQATTQAIQLKPDLILLDIMMPAGGGLEALKNLRANVKTFSIPVIVLTAKGDKETKEAAEGLGISGYFVKTANTVELLAKIKKVLGE